MTRGSPAVIGLDIGTSAVKGIVAGTHGWIEAARHPYELVVGPGRQAELDALAVAHAAEGAIAALAARATGAGARVVAVCTGGSGDEAVWVDAEGAPVAPVPMSLDGRAAQDVETFIARVGASEFAQRTGLPPTGTYPLQRFAWLRRVAPRTAARVRRLLAWSEYVATRLGVDALTETTLAARSGAFNVEARRWDASLLAAADADESLLPPLTETGSVIGVVAANVATRLSLPEGVTVVSGGFDQAMATLGAGVRGPGMGHVGAGSWEALTVLAEEPPFPLVGRGFSVGPSIAGTVAWSAMASSTGGAAVGWLARLGGIDPGAGAERVAELASAAMDGPTGVIVLPDLASVGDRRGLARPGGVIADLRLDVDAPAVSRAVLEGVAIRLGEEIDAAKDAGLVVDELRASGAGSRDRRWLQLRADVTGIPVRSVEPADAGAAAAAMLAAAGVGLGSVDDWFRTIARTGRVVEPRSEQHRAYGEMRDRARAARAALADREEGEGSMR